MDTMACKHCGTNIDFLPADHGRQFVCTSCGKPGIYGFGADEPNPSFATPSASPFASANAGDQPVPAPIKPKAAGGVLTWVGGGVIGVAAIFGLIGKGARHAGKAAKAVPTRSIPAQLPSKFTAPAYRTGTSASSGFAPSVAPSASGGMTYVPLGAGIHASRAASRAMSDDEQKDQPLVVPQAVPALPAIDAAP